MGTVAASRDRSPPAGPIILRGGYSALGAEWVLRGRACAVPGKFAGGAAAAWRIGRGGWAELGSRVSCRVQTVRNQALSGLDPHCVAWLPSHGIAHIIEKTRFYCAVRLTAGFARGVAAPIGRAGGASRRHPAMAGGRPPFASRARVSGGSRSRRPEFQGFAQGDRGRSGPVAHDCNRRVRGTLARPNGVGGAGRAETREISRKTAENRGEPGRKAAMEMGRGASGLRCAAVVGQGSRGGQAMAGALACQPM
jgi:hypothetical protein